MLTVLFALLAIAAVLTVMAIGGKSSVLPVAVLLLIVIELLHVLPKA